MSNLLIINPVSLEDGLDYVFAKMGAIYGASFNRAFEGLEPVFVRQVWSEEIGQYLKSKEILDHALRNMHPDYPPSALKFRDLCKGSKDIFDLETRSGIEKLAEKMGSQKWDEMVQWSRYKGLILEEAERRGLI